MQELELLSALLLLLIIANGAPVIARYIFTERFEYPLDAGLLLNDGRPLFGHSKTVRGIVSSLLLTTLAAPVLGFSWQFGLLVSVTSMLGDLFSSFIKRRLNKPISSRFIGLDQIPESLFPALAIKKPLALGIVDISLIVLIFVIIELLLSRILFTLKIRKNPY